MASSNSLNGPYSPPTSDNDTTVIIFVFVSVGCVLFLVFVVSVICFLIKRQCKKTVDKRETVRVDEHLKVKEAIVNGPDGPHAVVISVEDDVRMEDKIKKDEKALGKGSKAKGFEEGNHGLVGLSSNYDAEH